MAQTRIVGQLARGARLRWDSATGSFQLVDGNSKRTVQGRTVDALDATGLIERDVEAAAPAGALNIEATCVERRMAMQLPPAGAEVGRRAADVRLRAQSEYSGRMACWPRQALRAGRGLPALDGA